MKFEHIRNSTIILEYAGKRFLIDPWFADKGSLDVFADNEMGLLSPVEEKNHIPMPMTELPKPINEILAEIDVNIITHIHPDHIDIKENGTCGERLNKKIPIFVRAEEEADTMKKSGFENVFIMTEQGADIDGIKIFETPALHGTLISCGPACGVVLQNTSEPTVYITGDTIWYDEVKQTIKKYNPDIIIVNACGAEFTTFGQLMMNDKDVCLMHQYAPDATIVAVHLDTVSHQMVTREDLKKTLKQAGINQSVIIPDDGESFTILK